MAILEVKNIRKSFDGEEVLKGIDFSLEKGEVLAIIGSSGSGTTTLLRCLNFLVTPDEGQICIHQECIYDAEQAKKVTIGEQAEIQNSWYYNDISATLVGILASPAWFLNASNRSNSEFSSISTPRL